MRYEYRDDLASSCLFATVMVGMTPRWSDETTPRTDRPVRFRFYASRCNAWQGFPLTIQVPRIRA